MAPPPTKRTRLLSDAESTESDDDRGVKLDGQSGFKINEAYAKRFEHNKKREEKQKLEDKYKGAAGSTKSHQDSIKYDDESSDESSDESEDDEAELATMDVDDEIMATLQAIKNKDPRVYDKESRFYRDWEQQADDGKAAKERPMYLQDYHREQLMAGHVGGESDEDVDAPPKTYQQEQDALRQEMVVQMHGHAPKGDGDSDDDDDDDDFLVKKPKAKHESLPATEDPVRPSRSRQITEVDIQAAAEDPETYLSNFMASRAWLPSQGSKWQAFDSDDSEEERRADEFEEAYNMRFEDPATANEKLQSFARDVAKYSVRREEKTGRKRARERERDRLDIEKQERRKERERLKKLKMDEVEEKIARIRDAAGLRQGEELDLNEWKHVLDDDFDDEAWETQMKQRFGDKYYEDKDAGSDIGAGDEVEVSSKTKRKAKKPKWEDDIDIKDLVPEFADDDQDGNPPFTLSSDDEAFEGGGAPLIDGDDDSLKIAQPISDAKKGGSKDEPKRAKIDAKRAARKERRRVEELVDSAIPLIDPTFATATSSKRPPVVGFRYRETSPTSFGLSTRDILFANDTQLNQYAGLKKFASFRDEEKKMRDRKKFSKKGRLRQWRKDTFGNGEEPSGGFESVLGNGDEDVSNRESSRQRKKRGKKTGVGAKAAT